MTDHSPTTPGKTALVVRGGWDGHQPVEATELFLPFLARQRLRRARRGVDRRYADEDVHADVDLIVQCEHDDLHPAGGVPGPPRGGRARHRPRRLARRDRRLVPRQLRLPAADRRPVRLAPRQAPGRAHRRAVGQLHAAHDRDDGPRPPTTRSPQGIDDFELDDRAVLGAARRLQRRARDHHACRSRRGTRGTARSPPPRSGPASGARAASSSPRPATASTSSQDRHVRTIIERGMLWASPLTASASSASASISGSTCDTSPTLPRPRPRRGRRPGPARAQPVADEHPGRPRPRPSTRCSPTRDSTRC